MNKPKHIQLLQDLSDNGIGVLVNISPYLEHLFERPIVNVNTYDTDVQPVKLFVTDLLHRGFISFLSSGDNNLFELNYRIDPDTIKWLDTVKIKAYLTSKGLDYLDQYNRDNLTHDLNQSFRTVNQASLKNYKTQRTLSVVTVVLATISALFSWWSYNKTDQTAISVEHLRQELQQWRLEGKTKQTQTISPVVPSHKH